VVGCVIITLLQIVHRVCQWKSFENWSIIFKDMDKSKVPHFLAHPVVVLCVLTVWLRQWSQWSWSWCWLSILAWPDSAADAWSSTTSVYRSFHVGVQSTTSTDLPAWTSHGPWHDGRVWTRYADYLSLTCCHFTAVALSKTAWYAVDSTYSRASIRYINIHFTYLQWATAVGVAFQPTNWPDHVTNVSTFW